MHDPASDRGDADGTDATAPEPVEVDARGLACPMPVIELARALRDAPLGTVARLVATDATTRVDVPVWCRMQRQRLVAADEQPLAGGGTTFTYLVEKATAG